MVGVGDDVGDGVGVAVGGRVGVTVGGAVGTGKEAAATVTVGAVVVANESEQPARAINPASRTMMNNNRDFIVLATPGFRD